MTSLSDKKLLCVTREFVDGDVAEWVLRVADVKEKIKKFKEEHFMESNGELHQNYNDWVDWNPILREAFGKELTG